MLSPDFRGRARSSELRAASLEGGVAVLLRLGEERRAGVVDVEVTFGVCGLLMGALGRSGIPSSSKRSSGSGCLFVEDVAEGFEGASCEVVVSVSTPILSNWARSSSSVSFLDMAIELLN